MENPWSTQDRGPFRVSAAGAQSHEGDPAELRLIPLTARPGMGCAAGILCAPPRLLCVLPKAALCDGHPVPEAEESQVAGFPLALQVTSVVVRRQEPIATTAPLSPESFSSGGGLSRRKRGKWAACWARAREKGPVVARLTPPLSLRACACSSPADRGLLFQGLSRRPRAAPAGGIKGCSAGLPQTPVCSTRQVDAGPRVLTAPARAHMCPERSPLPLQIAG